MRLEEDIAWIIDICAIGIGFATGQPHLVAGAAKHLVHTEFKTHLSTGSLRSSTTGLTQQRLLPPDPAMRIPPRLRKLGTNLHLGLLIPRNASPHHPPKRRG